MKKMKKLFAVLLTLAMVMGMTMTTMAAEGTDSKITITGADGAEVKYAQIVKEDRTSTLGWKFATDDIEGKFVAGWNSATTSAGKLNADEVIAAMIAADMLENTANYNVEAGKINASANLSAALEAVRDEAKTSFDVTKGVEVSETGKGLYLIVASKTGYTYLPMAAYMDSQGTNVAVQAKGAEDQVKKTVGNNGQSVAPGDEVPYEITEQYAYIAPSADKTFTITDTLTNGTFKADSVVVKIDTKTAVAGVDYTITEYAGKTTFRVDFGAKYNSAYAGKTITITYTAIAGDVTTSAPLTNTVVSSNKTASIVEVKPVSFKVIKVDANNEETKLAGAEFQIYKGVKEGTNGAVELIVNNEKVYAVKLTTVTTDDNGEASVSNLDAQETYYVQEIEAPNGYSLNNDVFKLSGASVKSNTDETYTDNDVFYKKTTYAYTNFADITVKDTKLSALPSTGGIGTTIFTVAGCAIMIAAAALFFANRKKEQQ